MTRRLDGSGWRLHEPDCDLLNPLNQTTTVDLCGQISNLNFGKSTPTVSFDPQVMKGWGVRPADWQIGVTVQHEVLPRISVEVGYSRRWLQNFTVTDNLLQGASDFAPFSVVAPLDERLPGGGGYTVSGLFNANQNVASLSDNYNTYAPNFGKQVLDLQRPGDEPHRQAPERRSVPGRREYR